MVEDEVERVIKHMHSGVDRGHYKAKDTTQKIFRFGYICLTALMCISSYDAVKNVKGPLRVI